jgi:hypothetical protein
MSHTLVTTRQALLSTTDSHQQYSTSTIMRGGRAGIACYVQRQSADPDVSAACLQVKCLIRVVSCALPPAGSGICKPTILMCQQRQRCLSVVTALHGTE